MHLEPLRKISRMHNGASTSKWIRDIAWGWNPIKRAILALSCWCSLRFNKVASRSVTPELRDKCQAAYFLFLSEASNCNNDSFKLRILGDLDVFRRLKGQSFWTNNHCAALRQVRYSVVNIRAKHRRSYTSGLATINLARRPIFAAFVVVLQACKGFAPARETDGWNVNVEAFQFMRSPCFCTVPSRGHPLK